MTQDERNMLSDLANKIAQTPAPQPDAEAEDFIRKNIGSRPDALYLMTQTVLIQNMALQQSQHQIQELQQRLSQPVPAGSTGAGGSFLGRSAPPSYSQQPQYQQGSPVASAPPQYQSSSYGSGSYAGPSVAPPPSAMSGFLRGAAQTAAGVAAGTLAVQGIESLFSHHSGFGGGGLFGGGGIGGYAPTETVIENNYYDDPQAGGGGNDRFADASDNSQDYSDDSQLQDASLDDSSSLGDDSNYDDTGSDDSFS